MPYQSLPTQTFTIPFAAGLNTKGDKRAKNPPMLDICKDVEFDDLGGLHTRYPYAAAQSDIFGGGAITDARKIVANGSERLLFTKDALYSWSAQRAAWVRKATHLAIKVSEETKFVTTREQTECDRAELSGVVVYTWSEDGHVFWAATDKATGNVVILPQDVGEASRPRLVALDTKILIFFVSTLNSDLVVFAIDPANLSDSLGSGATVVASPAFNDYYDATKISGADSAVVAARRNPTSSYEIAIVTSGLVVTTSTKARTCAGPIAVSCPPTGTQVQVLRADGNLIDGDLITVATLADVTVDVLVGDATTSDIAHIAAAHRSVQDGGQYRCYVFWSFREDDLTSSNSGVAVNWVDTGGATGMQEWAGAPLGVAWRLGIASRAFEYDGSVYAWLVFARSSDAQIQGVSTQIYGQLQNSYFLYRADGHLAGKAATNVAGGYQLEGHLPGVQSISGTSYAWCGVERRRITPETDKLVVTPGVDARIYQARAPREIVIEFDSNEARRTARIGDTLYIAGGEIRQYDGVAIAEVGFHVYPWSLLLIDAVAGVLASGSYAYKATWRWDNARGERERGTTASTGLRPVTASRKVQVFLGCNLVATHKKGSPVVCEVWRTQVDPITDSPYYLITSPDPTQAAGDNRYVENDPTSLNLGDVFDNFTDAILATKDQNPENGNVLENLAPPPATIILATDTRLFLGDVAGDPDRVWYSKLRGDGEIAAFHEALTTDVPREGGRITGLAFLNETLVVFRERAIYALPGGGFDNTLGGANYGPARSISLELGAVNHESIAQVPDGLLFKSHKGWCLLTRGWTVDDKIGLPVAAYDGETPLAAHVMQAQRQVRILTANRMLVWDYLVNQWGEWPISDGVDATVWDGVHYYLTSTGPRAQQSSYAGVDYGFDVESAWIKINELQGRGIVRAIEVLGEVRSAHSVRVRIARNYQSDGAGGWSYFYDKTWPITPTVLGGPLQLKIAPSIKRPIQALKVRLTAVASSGGAPTTETAKLTGLSLAVAIEEGLYSGLPAAQKQ